MIGSALTSQILHWVDGHVVKQHFVMKVWPRRSAGHADRANNLTLRNFLLNDNINRVQVAVLGYDATSMVNQDLIAVTSLKPCP